MWSRLEIRLPDGGIRFVPLPRRALHIGRGASNDIVLLHRDVPEHAGSVERDGFSILWTPNGKESPVSLRKIRVGPFELRHRLLSPLLPAAAAAVLSGGFLGSLLPSSAPAPVPPTPVELPLPLPARGEFAPSEPTNGVRSFQFDRRKKGGVRLHFLAAGVEKEGEVRIVVNGRLAGFAPVSGGWSREERLILPADLLRSGTNRLEFHGGTGRSSWRVRDLYVTETQERKEDEADRLFRSAEQWYRERDAHPGSLSHAREAIERSIRQWMGTGRGIPPDVVRLRSSIDGAENRLLENLVAQSRSATSRGDSSTMEAIYRRILDEFPDPAEPGRRKLKELLERTR